MAITHIASSAGSRDQVAITHTHQNMDVWLLVLLVAAKRWKVKGGDQESKVRSNDFPPASPSAADSLVACRRTP